MTASNYERTSDVNCLDKNVIFRTKFFSLVLDDRVRSSFSLYFPLSSKSEVHKRGEKENIPGKYALNFSRARGFSGVSFRGGKIKNGLICSLAFFFSRWP